MKLYRVEVRRVVYVVAQDALEAEQEGPRYANEDDQTPDVVVSLAKRKWLTRDGWEGSLVYGAHTEDYPAVKAIELNEA
jgi:hypothetical protein